MAEPFSIEIVFEGDPLTKSNNTKWYKSRAVTEKKPRKYGEALAAVAKFLMFNRRLRPTQSLVKLTVDYFYKSKKKKDIQNLIKTTADALEGSVYDNDFQVHEVHLYRHLDRKNPRVIIKVEEIVDDLWTKLF